MTLRRTVIALILATAAGVMWLIVGRAFAHCDTMDGPIVPEAQRALESGDVTPVLKWVRQDDEAVIREAFARTRAVRDRGDDVRQIADRHFLETLIRIHRAGEGEPFTGLKPAGSAPPIFKAADEALFAGSIDALADEIADAVRKEIKVRFAAAVDLRKNADKSIEDGRAYVRAYVSYVHFVEGLHTFLEHGAGSHGAAEGHAAGAAHAEEPHGP